MVLKQTASCLKIGVLLRNKTVVCKLLCNICKNKRSYGLYGWIHSMFGGEGGGDQGLIDGADFSAKKKLWGRRLYNE